MPTYEYVCLSCGTHVEVYQRFKDEPLTECGVCPGTLRKVFHPAGILFKGSGFYATDSRASRREKAASGDGSGGSGSEPRSKSESSSGPDRGSKSGGSKSKDGSSGSSSSSKERSA